MITTNRLILREWDENDIPELIKMNQDVEVMKYFPSVLSESQSWAFYARVQKHFQENGFGLFVVEDKMRRNFLGYTGFMIANFEASFTPCVEIGWRMNQQYWGNGYATEAAKACLEYAFDELRIQKIFSFTSIHNHKSEAVMQRIGMKKIGEFSHPKIDKDHYLNMHVVYKIEKESLSM